MFRKLSVSATILIGLAAVASSRESKPDPRLVLVRMVDSWSTLRPTAGPINIGNCVAVAPDGHFHLELHRQEFYGEGTTTVFESSLNERELQILQGLLNAERVKDLPLFEEPITPLQSENYEIFTAEVLTGSNMREVGYFSWKGQGPRNPDSVKAEWEGSKTTLQPLVEWFRALKVNKRPNWQRVSNSRSSFCEPKH